MFGLFRRKKNELIWPDLFETYIGVLGNIRYHKTKIDPATADQIIIAIFAYRLKELKKTLNEEQANDLINATMTYLSNKDFFDELLDEAQEYVGSNEAKWNVVYEAIKKGFSKELVIMAIKGYSY